MKTKKLLQLFFVLNLSFVFGQDMTKEQTIHYINSRLQKTQINVDNQGMIFIKDVGIFYYKDVQVDTYSHHPFQIQFKCIKQTDCIEDPKYNPRFEQLKIKYKNEARIYIDDKEDFKRLNNAFDYLFKELYSENLQKINNDPFSPENYKTANN